ncbi:MAG: hypothetical protein A3G32_10050 [Deltaproteobacteria bacterium RIFCSPLOWO2_12_FULL_40_28]|nr:MAG: hypothetical protein A3C45_05060 [Deltaproteobacteria bacterium RIFCSPHIGHO2_02_FULL_40_28]OGQ20372.1 MAG: hypothetical protein A3E27_00440 [Deltaproteobacteria bacterium RIFCSPHIGHO2_12_FULL_40_32]OGQ41341.1 MAG: hypothetical protein A3I69_02090 [Deltaproteobacteria bacterium RIFCSPLOWO2_02_FULL_40_36]OGQ54980.1 MAG: hypothetical protein A3G32_10050 [Deltaproteobacteria bacterium RIFCSPLOWO2_12_FULL_40_28]
MKILRRIIFLFLVLIGFVVSLDAQATDRALRIVSLKPNITEILFALGLGNEVVGVTTYCDYPPQAKKLPPVADYIHADIEAILAQKPTLVMASEENSVKKEIEFLLSRGIPVKTYGFQGIQETLDSIQKIADILGVGQKGAILVAQLKTDLLLTKNRLASHKIQVLALVGKKPIVVVGENNFVGDMIKHVGLENGVVSNTRYPILSLEEVLRISFDVILDLSMGNETLALEKIYPGVPHWKSKKRIVLDMNLFRPSPRLMDGVNALIKVFETP